MDIVREFFYSVWETLYPYLMGGASLDSRDVFFLSLAELWETAVGKLLFCMLRTHPTQQRMIADWRVAAVSAGGNFFLRPERCAAHYLHGERCGFMAYPPSRFAVTTLPSGFLFPIPISPPLTFSKMFNPFPHNGTPFGRTQFRCSKPTLLGK